MRSKRILSAVTAVLMAAACMLPCTAIATDGEAAVTAATDTADAYETLSYDDISKNVISRDIDGYFYRLEKITSSGAEHSTVFPTLTPKGNGAFSADLSYTGFAIASSGKKYKEAYNGEHNYCINYEFKEPPGGIYDNIRVRAKAVLSEPEAELSFYDISETNAAKKMSNYIGTIEMNGETYLVAADRYTYASYYRFYRVRSDEEMENKIHSCSYPVYALIDAAKTMGLETGRLDEISVVADSGNGSDTVEILKNEIYEDETSILDKEEPYKIGADLSKGSFAGIIIDNYEFYCDDYFISYGSKMNAFTKGRFTGEYKAPPHQLNKVYAEFSSMYKFEEQSEPNVGKKQDISIDYSLNDKLKGKYGIFYDAYLNNDTSDPMGPIVYRYFDVAEKISGMDVEEFFKTFETVLGNNHLDLKSVDPLKTYTLNGHEYDLYRGYYKYYGCAGNHEEIRYLAVRKDSAEDEKIENTLNFFDHMKQLDDFSDSDTKVYVLSLIFRTIETEGTFEVTKQNISVIDKNAAPEVIRGDFNGDDRIDSMDVSRARTELLKSMRNDENADIPVYADVNLNGKFDVADIVMLQSFVLGKIKSFPEAK